MAKKHVEIMEILEAFDLTRSAPSAADLASCDPKTARHHVGLRDAGLDSWRRMLHDRWGRTAEDLELTAHAIVGRLSPAMPCGFQERVPEPGRDRRPQGGHDHGPEDRPRARPRLDVTAVTDRQHRYRHTWRCLRTTASIVVTGHRLPGGEVHRARGQEHSHSVGGQPGGGPAPAGGLALLMSIAQSVVRRACR